MNSVKIPWNQRYLLLAGRTRITLWQIAGTLLLKRWAGELPPEGVLTETGLAAGCCGHYSFWRWRIRRHEHPGDRPVPDDMRAAMRGDAPVPDWFLSGGQS